jgi:alpha-D-ribose 1-methylphosphonate 5-phosphate C-P lyase
MFTTFIIIVVLVLAAALTGFIFVQIKAGLYWRLVSIVFVVFGCSWFYFQYGQAKSAIRLGEYIRGSHAVIEVVDQLATEGRTNDVHQVCQQFLDVYYVRVSDITNLDRVVDDAESRVSQKPFTLTKP